MRKLLCALLLSAFVSQAFAQSNAERQMIDLLGQIASNGAGGGGGGGLTDAQLRASAVAVSGTVTAAISGTVTTTATTTPKQYTGTPSTFTPATADATVFTLAAGEIGFIQNLSADAPLAVKKGASASTSSFSFILAPAVVADDGKGGTVKITDWVGAVSVAKITGTARYIAWKQAP